jgi:hypothetical protein
MGGRGMDVLRTFATIEKPRWEKRLTEERNLISCTASQGMS